MARNYVRHNLSSWPIVHLGKVIIVALAVRSSSAAYCTLSGKTEAGYWNQHRTRPRGQRQIIVRENFGQKTGNEASGCRCNQQIVRQNSYYDFGDNLPPAFQQGTCSVVRIHGSKRSCGKVLEARNEGGESARE